MSQFKNIAQDERPDYEAANRLLIQVREMAASGAS
jgi:hypothetical protein